MCTLILLYKALQCTPVIALHNRYLGKDTVEHPPRRVNGNTVCPIDVASRGTWIGYNDQGLLLAITNQETMRLENPGRSRGLLALDTLRDCGSAREARDHLMDPGTREPYRTGNFMVMDAEEAWHVVWDGETHLLPVQRGVYAVGTVTPVAGIELNDRAKGIHRDSEKRVRRAYELLEGYEPPSLMEATSRMMQVSADHAYGLSEGSICWHSPDFMQTSSTLVTLGEERHIYYCKGNACVNRFKEYDP